MNSSEKHHYQEQEDMQTIKEVTKETKNEKLSKKEISLEDRQKAENIISDTLEIENLDNFDQTLAEATKNLPKYKELKEKLVNTEKTNFSYELFNLLKKDADNTSKLDKNIPRDGVLVKSMKQGHLECAGRTLIASTLLKEKGIDHMAVSAPGHSFLLIEQTPDTLAYCDCNNNLFFTFPKESLAGYKDTKTTANCKLKPYSPRKEDVLDGVNTTFDNFVVIPTTEGVGRQYLDNVTAALNGNEEFSTSGVKKDNKLASTVQQIKAEKYGENKILEEFYSKMDNLLKKEELLAEDDKKIIGDLLTNHPKKEDFVDTFSQILDGAPGNRVLYIKNAPKEEKKKYAEKLWEQLQQRTINETITGR